MSLALLTNKLPIRFLIVIFLAIFPVQAEVTTELNFNNDWGYFRGSLENAEAVDFDDSAFVGVTIPHTSRLEKKHCNGASNVYQGEGWYRRYFTIDSKYKGHRINVDFEGVMIDSEIFLNGEKVHTRNGGYIGFSIDLTDKIKWDGENILAVKFSNKDNPDTPPGKPLANLDFHYYGGIYRDVVLRITPELHITHPLQANKVASGGVFVTFPEVSKEQAKVQIKTHILNEGSDARTVGVRNRIIDTSGKTIAEDITDSVRMDPGSDHEFIQTSSVKSPRLWHPNSPHLYSVVTEIMEGDVVVDRKQTRIGIRHLDYKPDGLYINGDKFFIRGANRHQCYPYVGDAAPNSMQRRDALQMKANGFNSVRAAHYPQDPAFLDACDELGILVIECQPGWQFFGKSEAFYNNTLRDTREMIRRDRNRPSVILWEASLNETWVSEDWARQAVTIAHEEYPGGQIFTAADYGFHGKLYDVCFKVVDRNKGVEKDADPEKPFFTREWGDWGHQSLRANGEAPMLDQVRNRQKQLNGEGYTDWGGLDACKRIGGYWLWSWNDYPRGSSDITLGSGAVDCDRYEKYSAHWLETMVPPTALGGKAKVFITGTNSPSSDLQVDVYSNTESVRLYRNKKLIGELSRKDALRNLPNMAEKGSTPYFSFKLDKYEAGELSAEGIINGKVVARHKIQTPGKPAKIEWEIRSFGILPVADGSDLIPLHFKIMDKNGTIIPDFKDPITISVSGAGELVGRSIPRIGAEIQSPDGGIGFVFVRSSSLPGKITVKASGKNLKPAQITFSTKAHKEHFVPASSKKWRKGIQLLESAREPGAYPDAAEEKLPGRIIPNDSIERITATSVESSDRDTDKLRDGITLIGTGWLAKGTDCPQSVTIEFKKPETLTGSRIYWEKDSSQYCYDLEVSPDGIKWEKTISDRRVGGQFFKPETFKTPVKNIKYVRVTLTEVISGGVVDKIGISEWVLYGE